MGFGLRQNHKVVWPLIRMVLLHYHNFSAYFILFLHIHKTQFRIILFSGNSIPLGAISINSCPLLHKYSKDECHVSFENKIIWLQKITTFKETFSFLPNQITTQLHKVKMQYVHHRSHTYYFLLLWKIPKWPDDQCIDQRNEQMINALSWVSSI